MYGGAAGGGVYGGTGDGVCMEGLLEMECEWRGWCWWCVHGGAGGGGVYMEGLLVMECVWRGWWWWCVYGGTGDGVCMEGLLVMMCASCSHYMTSLSSI